MFNNFSDELKKILNGSKKEMVFLKHSYIGTEHFVLSCLKYNNNIKNILNKFGVTYDLFRNSIIDNIGVGTEKNNLFVLTPLFKKILEESIIQSNEEKIEFVDSILILKTILEEAEGVAFRILCDLGVNIDLLYDSLSNSTSKFNSSSLLFDVGYLLNDKELDPVIGRDKEIESVIEILLRKNKCNPILIGEAGVGKTAIVEGLAKKIVEKDVPRKLLNKKIISMSIASLVSGTKYRGEFEEKLLKIIKELENHKDYILFIDEIHTIVKAGGAEGAIDASNILKPALARGNITVIGATTTLEYKKYIEDDKALSRRFQKVIVKEPKSKDLLTILRKVKPSYEKYHNVIVDDSIIKYIMATSKKYILNRNEPDRSIDILDEVSSAATSKVSEFEIKNKKLKERLLKIKNIKQDFLNSDDYENALLYRKKERNIESIINYNEINCDNFKPIKVKKDDVDKIISLKCNIDINSSKVIKSEFKKHKKELKKIIVNQDDTINKVFEYIKPIFISNYILEKPISLLFIGKSGVGKSFLVEKLNEVLFNGNFIKIDLSLYRNPESINKIVGAPSGYVGYNDKNNVFESLKDYSTSLIVFENYNLANNKIKDLIKEIIDKGYFVDSNNYRISFFNCLIIFMSNKSIKNDLGFMNSKVSFDTYNLENNVTGIISFNELEKEDIKKIIKIKNKNIDANKIIEESNYKEIGAKKIDKLLNNNILVK